MDLRQLRCFVRVVELGSIARASRDLQVPRPSLNEDITLRQDMTLRARSRASENHPLRLTATFRPSNQPN